jgi:hypothetical protein
MEHPGGSGVSAMVPPACPRHQGRVVPGLTATFSRDAYIVEGARGGRAGREGMRKWSGHTNFTHAMPMAPSTTTASGMQRIYTHRMRFHALDDRQLASTSRHIHGSPRYRMKCLENSVFHAIVVRKHPL